MNMSRPTFLFVALLWMTLFHHVTCRRIRRNSSSDDNNSSEQQPQEDVTSTTLSNGLDFPMIGIGVGNLDHELMDSVVVRALQEYNYRLIDTNQKSDNEHMIANAIEKAMKNTSPQDTRNIIHVVTKIWYTHLGYQRTRLAVEESLERLLLRNSKVDVRVHMLIHWPWCNDDIEWMDCLGDEEELPQHIKDAGPPPHLDKPNAWKESWKALEDMYDDPKYNIASIGVSNFELQQVQQLLKLARIQPSMIQSYIWTALHDDVLMKHVRDNNILFQAYGVMNSLIQREHDAPLAYERLEHIGHHLTQDGVVDASQVLTAWLVQNKISTIPRASSVEHLESNSPRVVGNVPDLSKHDETIHDVCWALLEGHDFESNAVEATFINVNKDQMVHLYWRSHEGQEIQVAENLHRIHQHTFPNHVFVAYDETKSMSREYVIDADFGSTQTVQVNLSQPKATFSSNKPVHLYWWSREDEKEIQVKRGLQPGEAYETKTHPGHVFVAYDESNTRREFLVTADYGDEEHFHIEL